MNCVIFFGLSAFWRWLQCPAGRRERPTTPSDDHGDAPASATFLTPWQTVNGAVEDDFDLGYFRLQAEQGQWLHVEVLNETRKDLALYYLERSRLHIGEVSFLLGFESPNSFSRAFNSWTGESPRQVRSSLRVEGRSR